MSFEDIADWFDKQNNAHSTWRRNILMHAVERQRRSTAGELKNSGAPDLTLAKFKHDYRNYMIKNHPEFRSSEQQGRDREFYFAGMSFPPHMILKHRFRYSLMVAIFENEWKDIASTILPRNIPEEIMWITSYPSALHLSTGVEPLDSNASFASQTDLADMAMKAAHRLLPYASMVQQGSTLEIVSRDL